MKKSPQFENIDLKFVSALDEVIAVNTELGIKPNNDSSIGRVIYPSNRSIISSVRSRAKHIPHLALMNFAKEFKVDMNYFYTEEHLLNYKPPAIKNIVVKGNNISGDYNTSIHAKKGNIKGINTAESGSKNTLVDLVEVNTMINNFISEMDKERITQFMTIISQIQTDSKASLKRMELQFQEKCKEVSTLRESFTEDLATTRKQLAESREKLDQARINESEVLRQMLTLKSNVDAGK
ncbi:hypothetical protein [uncultured Winogradskyella sp.]|uniref:hypothetical protein n=1 Tax=uncultured Winogradskyella sp. TaxID=395353 RepID=UPI0030D80F05|tara:strand:- start:138847 stop:139557 length:711 start_codon:yes stop_codon:yes gene_type:complete